MITCPINSLPLEQLYKYTFRTIKDKLDNGKTFDVEEFMSDLFEESVKNSDKETAAKWLQSTPRIINIIVSNTFSDKIPLVKGLEGIYKMMADFSKPGKEGINNVLDKYKVEVPTDLQATSGQQLRLEFSNEEIEDEEEEKPQSNPRETARLKTPLSLSGTFPAFTPVDPNKKTEDYVERLDEPRANIINNLNILGTALSMSSDPIAPLVYQGKTIKVRATNLYGFSQTNYSDLDPTTQTELKTSQALVATGRTNANVTQADKRVILVVTDQADNVLYFDEDGNITDKGKGKPVYQFMRDVRKTPTGYVVTDIYGAEDQLMTPEVFAKQTYNPDIDGDFATYLEQVKDQRQKDLKELYDLREEALGTDVELDFAGITTGVSSELTATKIPLSQFLQIPGASKKSLKTIETLKKAKGRFKRGRSIIKLNNSEFQVNRSTIPEAVADQIAAVMFNPNISFEAKLDFYSQFIPEDRDTKMAYTMRKHEIIPDFNKKSFRINLYENVGTSNGFVEAPILKIPISQNALTKATPEQIERGIKAFSDALKKGQKNNKPTFISYKSELLANEDYLTYNATTGQFQVANYINFLTSLDGQIDIIDADPGFYNKHLLFNKPTQASKRAEQAKQEKSFEDYIIEARAEANAKKSPIERETERIVEYATSDIYREILKGQGVSRATNNYFVTSYLVNQINLRPEGYSREFAEELLSNLGSYISGKQVDLVRDAINENFPLGNTQEQKQIEIIQKTVEPEMPNPTTSVPSKKKSILDRAPKKGSLDRAGYLEDEIGPEDTAKVLDWWDNTALGKELQKHIELEHAYNLVNSDVYARFVVSGATLTNPNMVAKIKINPDKGTMVDIYHEAWHAFSQLYLTRQEKYDLYDEVINYKDAEGKQPYLLFDYKQIDEFLAEDFRTYMKKNYIKKGSPMRNKLFRKIMNFLRSLFGLTPVNPVEIHTDIMNIPKVRQLFEELNYSSNKKSFVRRYQANIDNVDFFELDRGIAKVRKPSDSALSKQDSDLVSNSMDMIISDIIDEFFEAKLDKAKQTGNYNSLKSGTIGLLLDPDYRAFTYGEIQERLQEKLNEFKTKLHKEPGITPFSKIAKLESDNLEEPTIKSEAVAVLTDVNGEHKYVFLQSQIDGFDNLIPNLKKGTRVRGESWHGIKIVGDFYTHKSVKENKAPVEIIVVSNIEDAQIQFDNYVSGGAKKYIGEGASVELKDVPNYELSAEQELTLDNVRILTAALDNFGDPQWELKGEKPTGTIAYHLENSDFEISKTKYYLEKDDLDEKGEEIDEDEQEQTRDSETSYSDSSNKKPLLSFASKEVVYVLKSLHKVNREGETSYNRLGFKERADFKKVWGIISKNIGGIRDREVVYKKLMEESKNFPEIKQLIETKLPDPTKITNMFEQQLSNSFWQTFARPSVKYWQFTVFPQYAETMDMYGETEVSLVGFESDVTESSLAVDSVIRKFESLFKSSKANEYIDKNDLNQAFLNLSTVAKAFEDKKRPGQLDINKSMQFAAVLGIKLDKLPVIEEELTDKSEYYGLPYFYDIIKDFNDIKNNPEATEQQQDFLAKFISNPISILRSEVPKGVLKSFKKEVAEKNVLKRLAELQIKYGYENANPGVMLPDGNIVYETINHSQLTVTVDALNTVTDLSDLWTDPKYKYMSHLRPGKSFFTLRSKILSSMFDMTADDETFEKKNNRSLQLLQTAGTQIAGIEGFNTADLDKTGKFFQELHSFGLKGIAEFIRHAEKKSAFGIKQQGGKAKVVVNGITNGVDQNLYIDMSKFVLKPGQTFSDGEIVAAGGFFLDYIAAEFDRIRFFKENPKALETIKGYNRKITTSKSGKIVRAGELFTAFDNILSKGTKAQLYKLTSDPAIDLPTHIRNNQDLYLMIQKDIVNYFQEKVESLYNNEFSKINYVDPELYAKLGFEADKIGIKEEKEVDMMLLKAYLYNDWIHKFETFNLINGDLAQFDHDKQNASKRAPGSSSDGDPFLNDQNMHDFINNKFNKGKTYASKLAKELNDSKVDQFVMNGILRTGVIADAKRTSVYLDDFLQAWEEKYRRDLSNVITDPKKLQQEIDRRLAKDAKAYKEMTESDGAAFLTFDAYRTLRFMNNKWSTAQEELYQKIIAGEEVDANKVKEFFPIYKLQYYGSIANAPIATTGMHKFAVAPIIPTIAVPGTVMYDLHLKMLKSNMQYYAFGSGSKVATLTTNGDFDDIYLPDSQQKAVDMDAPVMANEIYLEYLKDVTAVSDKLKGEISYPTQKRVLLLDGLFNVGEVINSDNKAVVDGYKESVDNYTEILTLDLLNKIGYEYNPKTKTYTGQLDKFIEMIREELGAREVPDHLVKLLDTRVTGNLSMDFSIHPEADTLEKIIVNRIQKSVIKQKTKGEALIQAPSTFYNGIWDKGFNVIKDPKEIKKLLGSNNLPFYRTSFDEKGNRLPTDAMKLAISLSGDFLNLLKLNHPDGDPIGTRDRLNDLVKDDKWLEENRDLITITGPRIPTDAANSMEFAEVWHFLDPAIGNTVIVPTEIVAKAGSDFDVDKIFFMLPNITSNGELVAKPAESLEDLRKLVKKANKATLKERKKPGFRSATSLINQYKKWSQNQLIKSTKEILSLPENYASLVKPNNTYLIEDQVKYYDQFVTGYNLKKNAHGEPVRKNFDGDKEVMSPSRVFDLEYNLGVHEQMLSGNLPLGILAKKNKVHSLFKSVGSIMPKAYKATIWNDETKKYDEIDAEYKVVMPIKHQTAKNKAGETVVSLSNENNVDGEKIGDVLSHGLQGILDRANNPFPHKLKIIKEAINTINRLIESGASVPEVFAFINNPTIVRYLDNQIYLGGSTSKLLSESVESHQVKAAAARFTINEMIKDGLDEALVQDLAAYANDRRLTDVANMLKKEDLNKKYSFIILNEDGEASSPMLTTGKRMFKSKDFPLDRVTEIREYADNIPYDRQREYYKRTSGIANNSNYYYAGQAAWTRAFGSEDAVLTERQLKDLIEQGSRPSIKNLAMLLRMIQLEKQFSGMDALEMAFSPDTGLLDTTLHVKKRDNALAILSEVSKVDSDFLDRLRNKSILSSFYKSDMILDLVVPLFALRLNDTISDYISDTIHLNKEAIAQRYGVGVKGQERFTNTFNNAVVNYIYQNTMSNYPDENGQPVLLPKEIHKLPITEVKKGPAVILNEKGFSVNLDKAQEDYLNKIFLAGNNSADSYSNTNQDTFLPTENPFPTFATYLKFIVEKEYLSSVYPNENDKFLTERALMNSFNRAFIMGTTKYSYTDMVMNTISDFEDQNIKYNFPVLAELAPAKFEKDVNVLELNDKAGLTAEDAEGYYKNLRQLADPSVRKVKNKESNQKITDVFKNFSLLMFYQHGVGYSKLGFNKILEPESFVEIMRTASASFLENNISEATLDQIYNILNTKPNYKNYVVNPKDYVEPTKGVENLLEEFTDDDWEGMEDFIQRPGTSQPKSDTTINIYAGTGENSELSNFADRITGYYEIDGFTEIQGVFRTVEGAFQAAKVSYTKDLNKEEQIDNAIIKEKLASASGSEAKALGRKIKGLDKVNWDANSSGIMKKILLQSFKANPDALAKLLATGDATLTHTQDKGKWGKEFPKLLMEVRNELKPTQITKNPLEGLKTNSSGFVKGPVMNGFTKINNITGAEIYEGVVFNKTEADAIEKKLIEEFPKELAKPEQAAGNKWNLKSIYYGPIDYIYGSGGSRLVRPAVSMPAWLNKTVREVEKRMGVVPGYFDTALINRYTDKNTKLGMHTDAERNLVGADGLVNPTVLTVSFGANRIFQLEGVKNFKGNNAKIETKHGSVLVMGRDSQFNYLHGIEQGTGEDGTRYSITLRHTPDINQVGKTVTSVPTEEITNFYNALTEEQKNILGNLDGLIAAYEDVPFNQPIEDYIEMLKCKL